MISSSSLLAMDPILRSACYHFEMFYFKAPGRFLPQRSPAREWGVFEHLVEVADDQFASRQVNLFKSGQIFRYDQSHRRDAFGQLLGAKFSLKQKWRKRFPFAELITSAEFEAVWRRATPHSGNE